MFDTSGTIGVVGIVDWEVGGLGDPRWDYRSLALASIRRKYRDEPNPTGALDVSLGALANAYGDDNWLYWFAAAACFKHTAILGYNYGLHLRGRRPDPIYKRLRGTIYAWRPMVCSYCVARSLRPHRPTPR
jgi:aminoglycoside phosphotransferase (APT) family kinase protein